MSCCNARFLSYISATLQLVICVIFILFATIASVIINSDLFKTSNETADETEKANIFLIVCVVLCVIGIGLLVTAIVGIQQRRLLLVSIYVYTNYALLVFALILVFAMLAMNIINELPMKYILIQFLITLGILGLVILLLAPIFVVHRRMRAPPLLPTTYSGPITNPYGSD